MKKEEIYKWLEEVPDPEIPVLSVLDLGVIHSVNCEDTVTEIGLLPTYSGCPALDVFEKDISDCLHSHGVENLRIKRLNFPSWSTDMISEKGKEKLLKYGIAPPHQSSEHACSSSNKPLACPQCGAGESKLISQFGSTPCKSLYSCKECLEPFEYFKCL